MQTASATRQRARQLIFRTPVAHRRQPPRINIILHTHQHGMRNRIIAILNARS
jgi:hypothetical protein